MKNNIFVYAVFFHCLFCFGQNSYSENHNVFNLNTLQDSSTVYRDRQLSNWGYGASLYLGYGGFSGDLEANFKNFMSYGLSFTFEYKKSVVLGVGYIYSASRTKEDIPINEIVWNKDLRANLHRGELFIGHGVLDNKVVRIVPFFGVAFILIKPHEPNRYDTNYDDSYLYEKVNFEKGAYLLGAILDVKIRRNINERSVGYGAIRIGYSYYMPHLEKKYAMLNGNIHCITVGIGGVSRNSRE